MAGAFYAMRVASAPQQHRRGTEVMGDAPTRRHALVTTAAGLVTGAADSLRTAQAQQAPAAAPTSATPVAPFGSMRCMTIAPTSSAPAMVMRTLNAGSKYPVALRDAQGEFLNGSNTYKLHLPPDPPAALFWAVTAYNITDGTMPETPQLLPSINGFNKIATNSDGSVDLWFSTEKPADVPRTKLDSDYRWTQLPCGVAPLRHRCRIFRSDLEAGRCCQGQMTDANLHPDAAALTTLTCAE
jgi:hypothetical protein